MTITIIFFESALELIPDTLRNHPLIRKDWRFNIKRKKRGILLDGAIHRSLINALEDADKRGRPDIIHHSLMNICYSPLFKTGRVQVFIHTRNNFCIQVPSNWRVPVNYNRFCGLFSQLLLHQRVPLSGIPILTVNPQCTVNRLLNYFDGQDIYLCERIREKEEYISLRQNLANLNLISSAVFMIGGFQQGEPKFYSLLSDELKRSIVFLSLYKDIVPTWVISAKIIHWIEESSFQ
jgi:rRNA small subunit pseudouridine methyltransferase Nep1